jgi:hypothetical protein
MLLAALAALTPATVVEDCEHRRPVVDTKSVNTIYL